MKEISVVVLIEVKPGQREDQINAFNEIKPLVLAEDGCLQYELKANLDNDDRFIMIERWASEEALEAHFKTTHMVEAGKTKHLYRAKPAEIIRLSDI